MKTALPPAPKPRLAFRIGVTGARPNKLEQAAVPALSAAVGAVLRKVRDTIAVMAAEPALRAAYTAEPALLRLISPLAEGADRIVAEAALAAGFRLEVPMPFPEPQYESTFAADPPPGYPAFQPLFDAARTEAGEAATLALDGDRNEDEEAGYRAVGRFVVRNADLVIAIWDGGRGKPGGTGETVRYAAHAHVPVWWIEPSGLAPPRLLTGPAMFERRESAPLGVAAEARLVALLRAAVAPPAPGEPAHHSWLGEAIHRIALLLGQRREPLPAYFSEPEEPVRPWWWRAYGWMLDLIAPVSPGAEAAPAEPPARSDDAVEGPWKTMYEAADRHGRTYADRYRSSYVLIIVLAALTVTALGVGLALRQRASLLAFTAAEFIGLCLILLIVTASEFGRWHERWIAYRLLAELCRKQRVLARLGWSLPVARVTAMPGEHDRGALARDAWVAWYVTAAMRAAALPHGSIGEHVPRVRLLGGAMLAEQIAYHRRRRDRSRMAAHRLAGIGAIAFVVTVLLVLAKFVLLLNGDRSLWGGWLGAVCVALVALSTACVSLRAYAEFGLLHLQSERMLHLLTETNEELDAVDPARPLASSALGAVLYGLALAMLEDVQGWSLLFRTKTPEAG